MDAKDEKILRELMLNSRVPINQLAKKVGVSREVATYRIKQLVDKKIILNFITLIDLESLGYSRNGCWIQLKGIKNKKEIEILDFLIEHPYITYVGTVVGKWNVAFDIVSKDSNHLRQIIREILNNVGQYMENYKISNFSSEYEIYNSKILGGEGVIVKSKINYLEIDKIDKEILKLLSKNSRTDYVALSSEINLTASAIKYRIKRLERFGIIKGYSISLNTKELGYEFYNLQIKFKQGFKINNFLIYLRKYQKVVYFYSYMGQDNWDIDIGIIAKNSYGLRKILLDFREKFEDNITIYDIYTTLDILKSNVAPEGVFLDK